ncbi:MAG: nucleoside monophosphate kinase [Bacilli bacterium]|nr:nucleoside monophosphate kinase [Bacilli bacterium]
MKNIIFIAPPAAGKGTMSELLIEKYGYIHISTGDILRGIAKSGTEFGNKLAELLKGGELISDDIVYEAVKERLEMKDLDNGYILDGFPRNLNQAEEYDKILKEVNRDLGVVIYLDTPKDVLEKRITGRRLCEDCGSTYNVLTGVNTPREEGKCDKCGGKLYQRTDDNSESVRIRYQEFLDKTYPLIEYYKKKNVLISIDSVDPEETIKMIEGIIND